MSNMLFDISPKTNMESRLEHGPKRSNVLYRRVVGISELWLPWRDALMMTWTVIVLFSKEIAVPGHLIEQRLGVDPGRQRSSGLPRGLNYRVWAWRLRSDTDLRHHRERRCSAVLHPLRRSSRPSGFDSHLRSDPAGPALGDSNHGPNSVIQGP